MFTHDHSNRHIYHYHIPPSSSYSFLLLKVALTRHVLSSLQCLRILPPLRSFYSLLHFSVVS